MTTQNDFSLEIKRFIKAPPEAVYTAWTDPKQLQQWFGPEGVKTNNLEADARPGGIFRWDLTDSDGDKITMLGEFRELLPGRKVVFTWHFEDDEAWENLTSVVTVELSGRDEGTDLRLRHEQLHSEKSRVGHSEGWGSALDKLERLLSGQ
jgi:uncharacterized protein YndB with AHSA1/START domain